MAMFDLITGQGRSLIENDYRQALPLNMHPVLEPLMGAKGYMQQYHGCQLLGDTLTTGTCRGSVYNRNTNTHFMVIGQALYEVAKDGSTTLLGTIEGDEQVAMPFSYRSQAIIGGGKYYLYDSTLGFREVTGPNVGTPIDATYIDNFYVFCDNNNIYHTDLSDESSIDPLNFASNEFSADQTKAVARTKSNYLMVCDRTSISYWQNDGTTEFSFSRLNRNHHTKGIVATHALVEIDALWYMVGSGPNESLAIYRFTNGQMDKISTREIEKRIQEYSEDDLSNIRLESLQLEDKTFLIVHLPNETLTYNVGLDPKLGWNRIGSNASDNYQLINGVYNGEQWVYGNKNDSRIANLDLNNPSQFGQKTQWEIQTSFIKAPAAKIDILECEILGGVSDSDTVFVALSKDGFSFERERRMSYGKFGAYDTRFIGRRFGHVRNQLIIRIRGFNESKASFLRLRVNERD